MIRRDVFYQRLPVCKRCPEWNAVAASCKKGHLIQSSLGCPLQKFEGVDGAGYMDQKPAEPPPQIAQSCCADLSVAQVVTNLTDALSRWVANGLPLASSRCYRERTARCMKCPAYKNYQCQDCKCVAFLKAKVATEECPRRQWPPCS